MDWFMDNWYVVLGLIVFVVAVGFTLYKFFGLPTEVQIAKVKEWLKYAVTLSEKELGGGTGQLKLRMVYDLFVSKFPQISRLITFDMFSSWVDEALEWMNKQLSDNKAIETLVKG